MSKYLGSRKLINLDKKIREQLNIENDTDIDNNPKLQQKYENTLELKIRNKFPLSERTFNDLENADLHNTNKVLCKIGKFKSDVCARKLERKEE